MINSDNILNISLLTLSSGLLMYIIYNKVNNYLIIRRRYDIFNTVTHLTTSCLLGLTIYRYNKVLIDIINENNKMLTFYTKTIDNLIVKKTIPNINIVHEKEKQS